MIPKPALAAAALLVALGTGVVIQSATSDDASGPTEPSADPVNTAPLASDAPSQSPSAEPSDDGPTTNEHEVDEPQVDKEAAEVATSAIQAYTQYSYRDPEPTSWIDRVAKYATEGYHHSLVEQFGAEDPYWDREVVPNERETRTVVTDVVVDGMHGQTANQQVYTVVYETSLRTKEMGHWGPADPMTQWVFLVKQGSTWEVADIVPTGSRSASDF